VSRTAPNRCAPRPLRREDRQAFALWLAAVWLLGFEVLPAAHLGMHALLGSHDHGVPHAQAASHCHGSSCHAHEEQAGSTRVEGDAPEGPAIGWPERPAHGVGSVAHRDASAQPSVPEVPPVLGARMRRVVAPSKVLAAAPSGHTCAPQARGPPTRTVG
jgi:hypothetical protein